MTLNFNINAFLKEVSILEEVVSLKCFIKANIEDLSATIKQLQNLRTSKKPVKVKVSSKKDTSLFFISDCTVRSINLQKELHFVLHLPLDGAIACQASKIMTTSKAIHLEFSVKEHSIDRDIESLLKDLSKKIGKPEEEILKQATSFYSKSSGKYVPGKTDINSLSEKQKEIVVEKLKRLSRVFNAQ